MEIWESLRECREQRGLSPLELAKKLQTSHQNIYRWESGQVLPSIEMCIRLADFYDISLDELVGRKL
ncbi:MAG: helix-turn-helix transcriptional regulator [Clostridia bacterium]|nr:helix-turn-helix transcriptional regulator [Clostridia bacterium]